MDNLLKEVKAFSDYLKEVVQIVAKCQEDLENSSNDEYSIYDMYLTALNNCYMYDTNYWGVSMDTPHIFFQATKRVTQIQNGAAMTKSKMLNANEEVPVRSYN